MTQTKSLRFLTLSAVFVFTIPLHALEVPWNQVCSIAKGNRLTVATTNGDKVDGSCMSVTSDEMALKTTDGRVVKIARNALGRIDMQRPRNGGHNLESLGKPLRWGLNVLFSPLAPFGALVLPPILAYDAVVAPFCLIGDLAQEDSGTEQITVI